MVLCDGILSINHENVGGCGWESAVLESYAEPLGHKSASSHGRQAFIHTLYSLHRHQLRPLPNGRLGPRNISFQPNPRCGYIPKGGLHNMISVFIQGCFSVHDY
jgi:hypothetical protein